LDRFFERVYLASPLLQCVFKSIDAAKAYCKMDAAWEVCLTTPTGKRLLEAEAIAGKYWREARASSLAALKEVAGIAANKVGHAVRCALCRREIFISLSFGFDRGGQSD
jgi:hypothetical protein